ncbi:MAG: class I SAM-dependent methyltransferase [bacterium]
MRVLDRVIIPEILDSLNPADPRARRSRRDLRWIDLCLGNSRWILSQLKKQSPASSRIVEIGAGEGGLCQSIQAAFPPAKLTGLDLVPRPTSLPEEIEWVSGDFFQTLPETDADTCVGSLILHHFGEGALRDLGHRFQSFRRLLFCEPLRSRRPLLLSRVASVFMGEVTRHDMPTSIRAGFRPGELQALLGLDSKKWLVHESISQTMTLRFAAAKA